MVLTQHQALLFAEECKTKRSQRLASLEQVQKSDRRHQTRRRGFSPPPWRPFLYGSEKSSQRARLLDKIILTGRKRPHLTLSTYPYLNKTVNGSRQLKILFRESTLNMAVEQPAPVRSRPELEAIEAALTKPTALDRFCVEREANTFPKIAVKDDAVDAFADSGFVDKLLREPTGIDVILHNAHVSSGSEKHYSVNDPLLRRDTADVQPLPPQWLRCDIFRLDLAILGKYDIIMIGDRTHADGSSIWDAERNEMKRFQLPILQPDGGLLFVWTHSQRTIERIDEQLSIWGYKRLQEVVWLHANLNDLLDVKPTLSNADGTVSDGRQFLQRTKSHCIVACIGNASLVMLKLTSSLDCDVIVAPRRRVAGEDVIPDEMFCMLERLSSKPKLLLFGTEASRSRHANWLTIGKDLDRSHLVEPVLTQRYQQRYPRGPPA